MAFHLLLNIIGTIINILLSNSTLNGLQKPSMVP